MFALQWCEFCWSVRKFFDAIGVPYTSIDLDSVEYQHGERGAKIRAVLAQRTGGRRSRRSSSAASTSAAARTCSSAGATARCRTAGRRGMKYDPGPSLDPYALLPNWLQPRKTA